MAQSYVVMIHGFMRAGQTEEAQRMFRSLQEAGHDAYTGWLAITNQLFAAGQQAAAKELIETRQPEWLPDADLYEQVIKSVCSNTEGKSFSYMLNAPQSAGDLTTNDAQIEEALQILLEMQVGCCSGLVAVAVSTSCLCWACCVASVGQYVIMPAPKLVTCTSCLHMSVCPESRQRLRLLVQTRIAPELRHIHPILEACALHGSASAAEKLIKQMTSRQLPSPDGHCMECLAKVCFTSWQHVPLIHTFTTLFCS